MIQSSVERLTAMLRASVFNAYFSLGEYFSTQNVGMGNDTFADLFSLVPIEKIIHFSKLIKHQDNINALSHFLTLDEIPCLSDLKDETALKSFILQKVDSNEENVHKEIKRFPVEKEILSQLGFYDLLNISLQKEGKRLKAFSTAEMVFLKSVINFSDYTGVNEDILVIIQDFKISIGRFSNDFSFINWEIGNYNSEKKKPFTVHHLTGLFQKDLERITITQNLFYEKVRDDNAALYIAQCLPFNFISHLVTLNNEATIFAILEYTIESKLNASEFVEIIKRELTFPVDYAINVAISKIKNPPLKSATAIKGNNIFQIDESLVEIPDVDFLLDEKFAYIKSII